ncbi:hypothetical protein AB2M62_18135 [Sphingomonas sp. MMS12-HWE2-04]|uniref:hypothetical protein n=1 Tax=Sphingomonas sp. MMS12-HWE2-04 TaxID=3234199 RepID=UPI00384E5AAC
MSGPFALALLALFPAQESPNHATRVERLIAALPPAQAEAQQPDAFAVAREKALATANPGKQAAIRGVMAAQAACTDRASEAASVSSLRSVAQSLTDADLDKLTEFYSGADYKALVAAGDKADMAPFLAKYPLERFMQATQKVLMQEMPEKLMPALDACQARADADLAKAGVRSE